MKQESLYDEEGLTPRGSFFQRRVYKIAFDLKCGIELKLYTIHQIWVMIYSSSEIIHTVQES